MMKQFKKNKAKEEEDTLRNDLFNGIDLIEDVNGLKNYR